MALKKIRMEDTVIGIFIVLALIYPAVVALFIYLQENRKNLENLDAFRSVYLFIGGLEDCSPEIASRIASFMERDLLHKLGGISGLVALCRKNKRITKGSISIEEKILKKTDSIEVKVEIKIKEKGTIKKKLHMYVRGKVKNSSVMIGDVFYAEGS